jgi:CRP-like cAMP-binding protein
MPSPHSPDQNHILAALPAAEFERLAASLELVEMPLGHMLYEPGGRLQHAYFPTTAIVSLHYVMESGASAESAGVGNEGVVGIALFMGGDTTPSSAVVQTAGHAYRMEGRALKEEFNRGGPMQSLLLRYTQALITQMTQTAACNQHHSVEQQLCRWLLLTLDRVSARELVMTQELVAGILGVRREGITEAAGNLRRAGVISYRRGHISVVERSGLQARACECYAVVKKELSRLLSDVQRRSHSPARSDSRSPACRLAWRKCHTEPGRLSGPICLLASSYARRRTEHVRALGDNHRIDGQAVVTRNGFQSTNQFKRTPDMLYTIAVVLLILWALGLVTSYTIGGFIHVLLVIAIVVVLLGVISGRRAV